MDEDRERLTIDGKVHTLMLTCFIEEAEAAGSAADSGASCGCVKD